MVSESDIRRLVRDVLDEIDAGAPAGGAARASSDAIAVGADHGGFRMKEALVAFLRDSGHSVEDVGTDGPESVDYPDYAQAVAERVADGRCRWGIVVDGAGIGSCMVANKVPGVRAAPLLRHLERAQQPRAQPRQRAHPGSGARR